MKLVIMLIAIVMLIGCNKTGDSDPITREDIYEGSDGLVMEFVKGSPAKEVFASYEGQESIFDIGIEVENKGAYDIESGVLTLTLERNYMDIDEWSTNRLLVSTDENTAIFNLEGKSTKSLLGDRDVVYIRAKALEIPEKQSETHTSNILFTTCYNYKTSLFQTVCVDPDVNNLMVGEKACDVEEISLSDQGAPIAVKSVEYDMLPHRFEERIKPLFKINIENVGKGEATRPDIISKVCSGESLDYKDFNLIKVSARLSNSDLNCNLLAQDGNLIGEARLKERKGSVRCALEEGVDKDKGAYLSPLIVEIEYGYTSSISKEIKLKRHITY